MWSSPRVNPRTPFIQPKLFLCHDLYLIVFEPVVLSPCLMKSTLNYVLMCYNVINKLLKMFVFSCQNKRRLSIHDGPVFLKQQKIYYSVSNLTPLSSASTFHLLQRSCWWFCYDIQYHTVWHILPHISLRASGFLLLSFDMRSKQTRRPFGQLLLFLVVKLHYEMAFRWSKLPRNKYTNYAQSKSSMVLVC